MPIVFTKDEWARIVKWTDPNKEDPETVRLREYVQYLDATSRQMTKSWPNSLENVNKRNEELRRARIEAAEQANGKFYKKYVKRKKEEQQELMYSARDIIFKNKDAPKLMLSAVIETVIQKERQVQLEFLSEQRKREAEEKRKDDADIIRKAKEWNDLVALKKKRRFDANKTHQRDILDQAHEVSERKRIEYETEMNFQKLDNMKANEEMRAIEEFERNFNAEEKNRILSDMKRSKAEADRRAQEAAARDLLDDKLIHVLQKSRARVEEKRIRTEKETREEKQRVLEKISNKLQSGDAAREAKENAILNKAIKEKEDLAEERRRANDAKLARFKQDRLDVRNKFLRDEAQRLHEFNTMRQWELMNRFKNGELYDDYQEQLKKEKERKIKEYREDILTLWKERDDRDARERAETRYFYGELAEKKIRDADNRLLTHAASLVKEAEKFGRPTRPLLRQVDRYCKLYRLYPMPELPSSLQEHFGSYAPVNLSAPDAAYREPPAPVREPDTPEGDQHRDGLQPDKPEPKPGPSKPAAKDDDFKRKGRANGLQRRDGITDTRLPPITVIPCTNEACRCELKK